MANGDKTANPPSAVTNKSLTLLWGATGEQEWTPALTTGLHTDIFFGIIRINIYFLYRENVKKAYITNILYFNVSLFAIKKCGTNYIWIYRLQEWNKLSIHLRSSKEKILDYTSSI